MAARKKRNALSVNGGKEEKGGKEFATSMAAGLVTPLTTLEWNHACRVHNDVLKGKAELPYWQLWATVPFSMDWIE